MGYDPVLYEAYWPLKDLHDSGRHFHSDGIAISSYQKPNINSGSIRSLFSGLSYLSRHLLSAAQVMRLRWSNSNKRDLSIKRDGAVGIGNMGHMEAEQSEFCNPEHLPMKGNGLLRGLLRLASAKKKRIGVWVRIRRRLAVDVFSAEL